MKLKKSHTTPTLVFYTPDFSISASLPFIDGGLRAGFPSPADNFLEVRIDFNEDIIKNKDTPFYAKVKVSSMKNTGKPVSIGFAPTKSLAKVANKIAKKYPERTKSSYVIDNEEKRIKALEWTKIEGVWGIGRKHAKRLKAFQINNAYQFTQLDDNWVRREMSVVGLRLKHDLMGISSIGFEEIKSKQNITVSRSFEKMYFKYDDIAERISTFSARLGEKLRKQNSHCNMIIVFINSNRFEEEMEQYRGFIAVKTDFPTNSSFEINRIAQKALKSIFKGGIGYKKAGIIVSEITLADNYQTTLFNGENPKH